MSTVERPSDGARPWPSQRAEEGADILDQQLGLFEGGEVAATREVAPVLEVAGAHHVRDGLFAAADAGV